MLVASVICKVLSEKIAKAGFPFLIVSLMVLLVTHIPQIYLFLPGLLMD